ncbi:D-alanyl-D-alanine carboxypeptidase/D-alanyl-D-alanine endopeptidase [Segetibacter koreensis]|uniref:D-alanyl-D-alanine carboxypeptidase/D-alanyl-D-alanine endopeptidase n=1 Tax=Segetibacter koreensis TaxID=398037 RepID=UPI0003666A35|nr:D-alanyl-D-alanine carboxypeptidase/D-alanyl-D-alanine-endopeptidase [Segetibacter koreensis]
MKTAVAFICSLLVSTFAHSQKIARKLEDAVINLEADTQMKSAIIAFYVIDAKSGEVIFSKNADIGLTVASSQKVLTSVASLELLGTSYRYKTELAHDGTINNNVLNGNIYLIGYGDPTLGSWRYDNTQEQVILDKWIKSLKQAGINQLKGNIVCSNKNRESQTIPGGWIWDDIGNYYGAGVSALNWRENQYDLLLKAGNREGDTVTIISTVPKLYDVSFTNELTTGKQRSGDNAYIYLPPYATKGFIRGTIPPNENPFTVSGSFPNPAFELGSLLKDQLQKQQIEASSAKIVINDKLPLPNVINISTHWSPSLDSINYWFLNKSINLYGEALVKTLGYEKENKGSTETGLKIIKNFWKSKGIEETFINIIDGSGLSPQNKVTAQALVKVMQYAKSQPFFGPFYKALPEINGIKMKSGSIGGVRSFTGYIGNYTFAVVINNYNGSSAEIVRKLYKLLDVLR